jgi:hypothetical protein
MKFSMTGQETEPTFDTLKPKFTINIKYNICQLILLSVYLSRHCVVFFIAGLDIYFSLFH